MSRTVALLGVLVLAGAGLSTGPATQALGGGLRSGSSGVVAAKSAPASFHFSHPSADQSASEAAAPIRLTASDGTGLSLVALEANGVLEPPLAFTELHLTFENPRDAVIEGRFTIALPPGAALSRFAMKIGGGWQEGEVVERQRARQAYEDFLHRKQDPALLEQEAGNEFSARVFPIPARGRKELIVSYSHALARADAPYVLPLHGLAEIGRLDIRVLLGGRPVAGAADGAASNLGGEVSDRRVVELHKRDWTPDRDFEIGQDRAGASAGLRHANLAVVRVAAPVDAVPQEIAGLYVLVDSSASRALGYASQVRRLAELAAGLRDGKDGAGGATPLGVAAFDQEVVPIFEGRADRFGEAEVRRLRDRRPLGASDLGRALAWLADRLPRHGRKYPRVLLITDGVATAGETEARQLKAAVHALGARGIERLDVMAVGGLRDEAMLRELTTGNLAHDGQRLDGAAPLAEIARRLTLACRSGIKVAVDGAAWVWPETLDGVQPGDETLVYADLPADRPLRLALDGRPVAPRGEPAAVERPLLERAWVQARIERLAHVRETTGDDDLRQALGLEMTELSVKHRVLSPFTALLVLETEADYARFGLDRRALADILTVGPGGLDVLARTRNAPPADAVAAAPETIEPSSEPLRRGEAAEPVERAEANETVVVTGEAPPLAERILVSTGATISRSELEKIPTSRNPPRAAESEGGVEGGVPGGAVGGVPGGVVQGRASDSPAVPRVPSLPPPPGQPASREDDREERAAPYTGRFAEVMQHLAAGRVAQACALAESWSVEAPGDVPALLALGEAWEASGNKDGAARAYGSLIDLFPSRADLRRLAGERLERLGTAGLGLAIDTYRKAVLDRPDHPAGHRLLAWALLRTGRPREAFEALEKGLDQQYPSGRFAGVDRVLREDLGLLAAAWLRAEPARRGEVLDRLATRGAHLEDEPSLRFVLTWETDANDVDLHVYDRLGGHAYYEHKTLPSGGELFADVTTGYGPECFAVHDPGHRNAAPYRLKAHYFSRGPMGYGMGTVQVIAHDGTGRFKIEPRPFLVMADRAMVDLGSYGDGKSGAEGR